MVRRKDTHVSEIPELPTRAASVLLLGNTDDLIRWNDLAARLESAPETLSDQQRVALLVRLANGKPLSVTQWNQMVGLTVMVSASNKGVPIADQHRDLIRSALGACLDQKTKRKALAAAEDRIRGFVLLHPEGDHHRVIASGTDHAIMYAITRAARSKDLRQCTRQACGDFYFIGGGRGAPPKYCSPECARMADTDAARDRMRRLRK